VNDLISWLRQQLDDDERWALAANQPYRHADEGSKAPEGGVHWCWVTGDEWETTTPDPAVDEFVTEAGYPCWLVTVEEWPVTYRMADGTPLRTRMAPRSYADQIVEMDAAAAGHIIRHDPARVLRQVQAHRAILDEYEHQVALKAENSAKFVAMTKDPALDQQEFTNVKTHGWELSGRVAALKFAVDTLFSIYSDRDGYKEEWA
jgi:hypothetical protein